MKKILQWVRACAVMLGAERVGKRQSQVAPTQQGAPGSFASPAWDPIDKARLQQFLLSDTGRRLLARWEARELMTYREQCSDAMHAGHSAGRARGFSDGREWLISLSRVTCVPVTALDGGAADEAEGHSHDTQPMEGESALRERFSP